MIRTVSQQNTIFLEEDFLKRLNSSQPLGLYEDKGEILIGGEQQLTSDLYGCQSPKRNRIKLPEDLCIKCDISPGQRISIVYNGFLIPKIILRKL